LTLEEVTHIRTVLTKAELESLIQQPELYAQVGKGKVGCLFLVSYYKVTDSTFVPE